ncbi:hypothetical protein PQX77_000410 [Marasmius sp. AFHP31]|nr:hypothetical protein PQX77_000410 [Marasmius sp. AFHP31]
MKHIKRVFKRKGSVSDSQEHSEHDLQENNPPSDTPTSERKHVSSKVKRLAEAFGAPGESTEPRTIVVEGRGNERTDLNAPLSPAMVIDQHVLDLFPEPPQHGQVMKSDIHALAFPSKPKPVVDRTLVYPLNEKLPPLLPSLDDMAKTQRKARRGAISGASQRQAFAQHSANANCDVWGPPPSAPPNMPLPPVPTYTPLSSRPPSRAGTQSLKNQSSFFDHRPVRRRNSTRSLGANVRLNPGPVAQRPMFIPRQRPTQGNLHLAYLRPIPDVPIDITAVLDHAHVPTEDAETASSRTRARRKGHCRCAIKLDENGKPVGREDHYLPTCPKFNSGF